MQVTNGAPLNLPPETMADLDNDKLHIWACKNILTHMPHIKAAKWPTYIYIY